jgi:UDP-GlcNAc:undecaprenyl-phosphate GlcNAc-1-phosphate transferase
MKFAGFFLAAAFLGSSFIWLLMRQAPKWGLMDHPGGRKAHEVPVPLVGGFGMFLACVVMIPFTDVPDRIVLAWLAASATIFAVGLADDMIDLSAYPKFAFQVAAALMMVLGAGVYLTDLGDLLGVGPVVLGALAVPVTVFAVVGVMNAMNMCDGADGLAGGVGLIALIWFAVAATLSGETRFLDELAVFAGAVAAFLALNLRSPWRRRASVFMGDSGSLFLGFMLAWFAIGLAESREPAMPPMTAVWILALPITDTLASMLRRILRGHSPFHADREHLHHILMAAGYTDRQAVAVLLLASLLCGAFGIGAWQFGVPESAMFYAYVGLFAVHFVAVMHAWKLVRLIGRGSRRHEATGAVSDAGRLDPVLEFRRGREVAGRRRPARRPKPQSGKGKKGDGVEAA